MNEKNIRMKKEAQKVMREEGRGKGMEMKQEYRRRRKSERGER